MAIRRKSTMQNHPTSFMPNQEALLLDGLIPHADSVFRRFPLDSDKSDFLHSLRRLEDDGLTDTHSAESYRPQAHFARADLIVSDRCRRMDRDRTVQVKKLYETAVQPLNDLEAFWRENQDPRAAVRLLVIQRLPADVMAFYRPFHFAPYNEWGIYIYVDELIGYCETLHHSMRGKVESFSFETLMVCVIFEIFHHEFFHHIVECAATTLELLSPAFGLPQPFYLNYRKHLYEQADRVGPHPHKPLEEALANAYAYNSLSFICRMKAGYKTTLINLYQKMLEEYWPREDKGYRNAGSYTHRNYINGAAHLLAMILRSGNCDPDAAALVSRQVLLNGNSAFFAKPDIPTYLVGSPNALNRFRGMIPAPNETYTQLFWPQNTDTLDKFIQERRIEKKIAAAAAKAGKGLY